MKRIVKGFNKLANDSNINLRKESEKLLLVLQKISAMEKISKQSQLIKDKYIAYCTELPFRIISPCSYLNVKTILFPLIYI